MKLRISVNPKTYQTAFVARTSRGAITQKTSYFVFLEAQGAIGVGEGSPLLGLSLDGATEWQKFIDWLATGQEIDVPADELALQWAQQITNRAGCGRASSLLFALESAALSLLNGQSEIYYPSAYTGGSQSLAINGLVWMDTLQTMRRQAEEKVKAGFTTIKFKIGSFDWYQEKALLTDFRRAHSIEEITVRVDANGAYSDEQALRVMDDLAALDVHSIEQPVKAGQHSKMLRLIRDGAVPIALDEELITPMPYDERHDMLAYLNAPYLVLKPSLIGGFAATEALIAQAEKAKWGWWLTSSLETPIALTPLAQFAARYDNPLPYGLSTGKIFTEPFAHPNVLEKGKLHFDPAQRFDIPALKQPDPPVQWS